MQQCYSSVQYSCCTNTLTFIKPWHSKNYRFLWYLGDFLNKSSLKTLRHKNIVWYIRCTRWRHWTINSYILTYIAKRVERGVQTNFHITCVIQFVCIFVLLPSRLWCYETIIQTTHHYTNFSYTHTRVIRFVCTLRHNLGSNGLKKK
jgi:hypothetical protein